jgi:diaminopimelate decarboxylase
MQTQTTDIYSRVRALLPDAMSVAGDVLTLDGFALDSLAERYGTPLYVYDEQTIRSEARGVRNAFTGIDARVSFASKACDIVGVMRVLRDEGLDLDVVSAGELEAGLRAGFQPEQIHLHGNCKTDSELELAIRLGLHAIVIDNLDELDRVAALAGQSDRIVNIMLRVTLAVESTTHPHLQTSGYSSKFGIPHDSPEEAAFIRKVAGSPLLHLIGVHAHLGSQIADPAIYADAAGELVDLASRLFAGGFPINEISVGGGWAVAYTSEGNDLPPRTVAEILQPLLRETGFRLAVEPGRALVARSGIALYRVGSIKRSPGGRIVSVDGGMGDNPRPALYDASYTALRVRSPADPSEGPATIAGRYCESGDVLVRGAPLPEVHAGDLICIPMSGAYHLSMASHYNLVPEPAVILTRGGQERLIVRRATIDDLLARNVNDIDR